MWIKWEFFSLIQIRKQLQQPDNQKETFILIEEFFPKIMQAGKNIVQDIRKKKKQRGGRLSDLVQQK